MKKTSVIVAAAFAAIALPASAFALASSPAKPTTISISGTGAPTCTYLPYSTTAKSDALAQITILQGTTKIKSLRATNVPAGNHTIRWCGKDTAAALVAPGAYLWHVQTRHYAGTGGLSTPTVNRQINVIA